MIGTETALNNRFGFFNITEEIMKDVESFDIPKNSVLEIMEFDAYTETMIDSIKNAKDKVVSIAKCPKEAEEIEVDEHGNVVRYTEDGVVIPAEKIELSNVDKNSSTNTNDTPSLIDDIEKKEED